MYSSVFDVGPLEIFGLLLIVVGIVFGNAAGVGGSGIIVPVLLIIFPFSLLETSALSNVMIFLAFSIRFISSVKQRHPKKNKPMIDFDAVSLMTPSSFLGTKLGLIVHDISPQPLLLILLMVTLTYLSYLTLNKGLNLLKSEATGEKREVMIPMESAIEKTRTMELFSYNQSKQQRIEQIREEEAKMLPTKQCILILALLCCVIITSFVEGGKGTLSAFGVKICSPTYWTSIILFAIFCVFVTYIVGRDIILIAQEKDDINYPKDGEEIEWTWIRIIEYSSYGLFSGILSAIYGIGGGMVLTPLLAQLKMLPEVVSSTGGVFVLLTTASSSVVLTSQGYWNVTIGILTLCSAMIGAFISIYMVAKIVKTIGRPSYLILIMAVIVFISGAAIGSLGLYRQHKIHSCLFCSSAWSFHSFCN